MKLVLNSFFLYLFFVCAPAFGEIVHKEFTIKVSGLKIGKVDWKITLSETKYLNEINLKSEGLLSKVYRFEGKYISEGIIKNNRLIASKYSHFWKTNKITKNMELVFQNDKLISLKQKPVENEILRIDIFNVRNNNDPLTSFLQIILGETISSVIDGRRIYKMKAVFNNKTKETVIGISNYSNLWADHKRNKFEKIIFEKNITEILPHKMLIYFDGKIFKLEQN